MPQFLILKLDGPMQAWGGHTYEDFRPSHLFPTRSGLLGLIGACMGLERSDIPGLARLSQALEFAVRADCGAIRLNQEKLVAKEGQKFIDFHTVMDARKVDGEARRFPVVSRREYLFDAAFTVAVGAELESDLAAVEQAVRRPLYTPTLGRRSCPLARPLLDGRREADNLLRALAVAEPRDGTIYVEGDRYLNDRPLPMRDVPMHGRHRSFGTRFVYVYAGAEIEGAAPRTTEISSSPE